MKHLFLLLSALLITSCTSLTNDIKIKAHANPPDVDYSKYKTYAWAGNAEIVFDPIGQWEQPTLDTDEEVRFLINQEMRALGFHLVESHPDLLVTFAAGVDSTSLGLKEDPANKKEGVTNIPRDALLVALIDASTGYTIWLSYAQGDVQPQQSIEKIRTRIDYAVSKIFKPYN